MQSNSSPHRVITFTASSSFVVPTNVYGLLVTMCGGGGGATGRSSGGSGAFFIDYPLAVNPGETLTITVGAGGTVGTMGDGSDLWSSVYDVTRIIRRNGVATAKTITGDKGGSSIVMRGATALLTAYGGGGGYWYLYYNGNFEHAAKGGDGGWPNGSGAGGDGALVEVAGGGCGVSKTNNSYGSGHAHTAGQYSAIGLGAYANSNEAAGRTPISGYGHGGEMAAQAGTGAPIYPVAGAPGVVILQYFS